MSEKLGIRAPANQIDNLLSTAELCVPAARYASTPHHLGPGFTRDASVRENQLRRRRMQRSAAQRLCNDDQQRRSQGEMSRTEGLCEGLQHGSRYAKA